MEYFKHWNVNKDYKQTADDIVWKFHYFFIAQILREINFGDSRSDKSVLMALDLDFYTFLHFLKVGIYQMNKI